MPNVILKKLRGLRRRIIDSYWERHFHVETYTLEKQPAKDGHWYVTVPYQALFQQFRAIRLGPADTFVDIGSGKGRALLAATLYKPARIIGVELNPALCAEATQNISHLKKPHSPIDIQNISATDFDATAGTVFYLFNPFGDETLRLFLAQLKKGLDTNPRPIRILYSMPWHESAFADQPWLKKTSQFQVPQFGGTTMTVTIWKNL
jgi:cyclopropane fatty-acyl-phospholipid synthase-like methyltransferase